MSEAVDKAAANRTAQRTTPYPSWTELLAQVGRDRPDYRAASAPPSREWRDVVADMINGRR